MTRDRFEYDAAPYVLGALDDAERLAFEGHLPTCAECRQRTDEARALGPLLATVPPEAWADEDPPAALLTRLLSANKRSRRVRAGLLAATVAAAACLATVVGVAVATSHDDGRAVTMAAAVADPSLQATARISQSASGTRIDLVCHYRAGYGHPQTYRLVVVPRQGQPEMLGTWTVQGDDAVRYTAGTSLARGDLAEVDVQQVDGTAVLKLAL